MPPDLLHEQLSVSFGFTKLVVRDLEWMAAYYCEVFDLHAVKRVRGERIGDEEIDEIVLSPDPSAPWGSLVLLRYVGRAVGRDVGRAAAPPGELILGFTTSDLPALLERVKKAGGRIHAPVKEMPEIGIRVAFATDPEGHLSELVQLLG
jgi:lactoylglutathione lyase